jgi:outer membrane biogenesis lipoprotein LolB
MGIRLGTREAAHTQVAAIAAMLLRGCSDSSSKRSKNPKKRHCNWARSLQNAWREQAFVLATG